MTTNIPRRGLSPSNPAPTNVNLRTSSSSQSSYQPMRAAPRAVYRKNAPDNESSDASNDKNAVALIRRVLCSDSSYGSNTPRPLQDLLPPLTSSNDVDLQLYALIAIIVKEFVYSWYAKITPDHVFIDEVLQLIAHCTRALEQRLRQVDVKQLVLDEIPGLVEAHIIAYRTASQGSSLVSIPSSTRDIYHQLNPHPGLSPSPDPSSASAHPEKEENERLYRHLLAQGVLAVLLPTEDLENVCLRTLVEDILSDLLLGNEVSGKICEGWFIWTAVSKVIETVRRRNIETSKNTRPSNKGGLGRLEKFGLLSNDQHDDGLRAKSQSAMSLWMWKMLYAAYLFYLVVRFVVGGLFHTALSPAEPPTRETASTEQFNPVKPIQAPPSRPVLDYQAFSLLSQWSGLPLRMPWLSGSFSLIQTLVLTGPGKLGEANSVIDRFLRELIDTYMLTPATVPTLLVAIRTTLFSSTNIRPNAALSGTNISLQTTTPPPQQQQPPLGTSDVAMLTTALANPQATRRPPPAAEEVCAIKRQCAADILSLFPAPAIAQAFFCGTTPRATNHTNHHPTNHSISNNNDDNDDNDDDNDNTALLQAIEMDLLDPFSDAYCNKHLIFSVIETVLVKLLPELAEKGVMELMEERGVAVS